MYTIQRITEENKSDIHLLNEPFKIWGRMTPLFDGKAWSYQTKELPQEKQYEMCFPDFENNYDEMKSEWQPQGTWHWENADRRRQKDCSRKRISWHLYDRSGQQSFCRSFLPEKWF